MTLFETPGDDIFSHVPQPSLQLKPPKNHPADNFMPEHHIPESSLNPCKNFNAIADQLNQSPHELKERIRHLKNIPDGEGILGKADAYFSAQHWEMAAVLDEYDHKTFIHSLRVASIVDHFIRYDSATGHYLDERALLTDDTVREMLSASIFHDIGKTAIPHQILYDGRSRQAWALLSNAWKDQNGLERPFDQNQLEQKDAAALERYLSEASRQGQDPLDIVPAYRAFDHATTIELEKSGIDPHMTFRKILEYHEQATRAILQSKKMSVAAAIASHHHDYNHEPLKWKPLPSTEIHQHEQNRANLIADGLSILRSADIYDALTTPDRDYYKPPFHPLIAMSILIQDIETSEQTGTIHQRIITDLYQKLKERNETQPHSDAEIQALEKILLFIKNEKRP